MTVTMHMYVVTVTMHMYVVTVTMHMYVVTVTMHMYVVTITMHMHYCDCYCAHVLLLRLHNYTSTKCRGAEALRN